MLCSNLYLMSTENVTGVGEKLGIIKAACEGHQLLEGYSLLHSWGGGGARIADTRRVRVVFFHMCETAVLGQLMLPVFWCIR